MADRYPPDWRICYWIDWMRNGTAEGTASAGMRTMRAGERVMDLVVRFLEERLRLRVNPEKSVVANVEERQFLGYRPLCGGRPGLAPLRFCQAPRRD